MVKKFKLLSKRVILNNFCAEAIPVPWRQLSVKSLVICNLCMFMPFGLSGQVCVCVWVCEFNL